MKRNSNRKIFLLAGLLLAGLALGGCQNALKKVEVVERPCLPPNENNLEKAFSRVKSDMAYPHCQPGFGVYFERLLEIAAGNPSLDNKKHFSEFLLWAGNEGLLSMTQSRDYYNRYFNSTFMSLPDDYNICSAAAKKEGLIRGPRRRAEAEGAGAHEVL